MDQSRRWALSILSVAVVFAGCGGDNDDDPLPPSPPPPPPPPGVPPSTQVCRATTIAGNHGHSLVIPAADLELTVEKTYSIQGQSAHTHNITLSPEQLAQIKVGSAITVVSGPSESHTHSITINCTV